MRLVLCLMIAASGVFVCLSAMAAPLFDCRNPNPNGHIILLICAETSLVALDTTVAAGFDTAIASATDPLTAMLLAGENQRRRLIFESADQGGARDSREAPVLAFLRQSLERDAAILQAIVQPQPNDGLAGDWSNAFGALSLKRIQSGYHLSVKRSRVKNQPDDVGGSVNTIESCDFAVDLTAGPDGWFVARTKKADDEPTKLTRQGLSLRLVIGRTDHREEAVVCDPHDAATGRYFRVTAQPDPTVIATAKHPERPSFACGRDAGPIETEICSDPELARLDRLFAKAYPQALARLDAETAALLKASQISWIKARAEDYDVALYPKFSKQDVVADNVGAARVAVLGDTGTRITMLNSLEGRRAGFVGDWRSVAGGFVHIGRETDGNFTLIGDVRGNDRKPMFCAYQVNPVVKDGILTAPAVDTPDPNDAEEMLRIAPSIWSDGRTLLVDADLGDKRPDYCRRNQPYRDRLFPVKGDDEASVMGAKYDLDELQR